MTDDEKPELQPAEGNPWYVLMTVAGPQKGQFVFDGTLHQLNRRLWNGWVAQAVRDESKARLIDQDRTTFKDVAPLTNEERAAIDIALVARCPDTETPTPDQFPYLPNHKF